MPPLQLELAILNKPISFSFHFHLRRIAHFHCSRPRKAIYFTAFPFPCTVPINHLQAVNVSFSLVKGFVPELNEQTRLWEIVKLWKSRLRLG